MTTPTVAVVGAGIAGLAAAWELVQQGGIRVVLLEAGREVGGKLRTIEVAGVSVDGGAESMLARRTEAVALAQEAGLAEGIVHPRPVPAAIWSRGSLHPLPPRTLMGVPADPASALGVLTPDEVARATRETLGPPVADDIAVGELVGQRLGRAVVDRLVEPLLAGVYAGHARHLSLRASVPTLWPPAASGASIVAAAAALPDGADGGPVFAGYLSGLGLFARSLADRLVERGVEVRTHATVRELARSAAAWRLVVGPTNAAESLDAQGVVLAVPGAAAARLLRPHASRAADLLFDVEYASVAIVTLALPRRASARLAGSGFLVPPAEPVTIKAATFSSTKWAWVDTLDPDLVLVRTSLGRAGETAVLQREDVDLARAALRDLRTVLGADLPDPVDTHVQRWGGGLPQYAVGHLDRVATVLGDVAGRPALGVAGAAYEGVGIPACVASGRRAAQQVAGQVHRAAASLRQ